MKVKGKNASEKALAVSKKVFGKPIGQKTKKRDRGQEKKQLYTSTPAPAPVPVNGTNGETDEMDDDDVQDMLDMLHDDDDDDDEQMDTMPKKRKRDEFEEEDETVPLEQEYAHDAQAKAANMKRTIDLLPIKTKKGEVITRSTEVDYEDEIQQNGDEDEEDDDDDAEQEVVDSDDEILNDQNVCTISNRKRLTVDYLFDYFVQF